MEKKDVFKIIPAVVPVLATILVPMLNTEDKFLRYLPAGLIILFVIYFTIYLIFSTKNKNKNEQMKIQSKKEKEYYEKYKRLIEHCEYHQLRSEIVISCLNEYKFIEELKKDGFDKNNIASILAKVKTRKQFRKHKVFSILERYEKGEIQRAFENINLEKKEKYINFIKNFIIISYDRLINMIEAFSVFIYDDAKDIDEQEIYRFFYNFDIMIEKSFDFQISEKFIINFRIQHHIENILHDIYNNDFYNTDYIKISVFLDNISKLIQKLLDTESLKCMIKNEKL